MIGILTQRKAMYSVLFEVKLVRKGILIFQLKDLKEMLTWLNDQGIIADHKRTDDGWDIDALQMSDSLPTVTHNKQQQEV